MDNRELEFGNFDFQKIREDNKGSFFCDPWFDPAIMGISRLNRSVIYSLEAFIEHEIEFQYDSGYLDPEKDEVTDKVLRRAEKTILKAFKRFQTMKDCVPPTLFEEFELTRINK